jgi:LemA protein
MSLQRIIRHFVLIASISILSGCGVNSIPTLDEKVKSSWAQVENQYQRRADLIPNLVNTVKGYAKQEKETLIAVVEARAKVGSMQIDKDLINDPAAL